LARDGGSPFAAYRFFTDWGGHPMAQPTPDRNLRALSAGGIAGVRPRSVGAVSRFFRSLNICFWAIVGVPTLIAGVYYYGITSDLYLSEVEFVVHGPANSEPTGIAGLLSGAGLAGGNDDAYAVQEYIMSRDAVRRLDKNDRLRSLLDPPGADVASRFPGMSISLQRLHDPRSRPATFAVRNPG
jgi:hypothetical protein